LCSKADKRQGGDRCDVCQFHGDSQSVKQVRKVVCNNTDFSCVTDGDRR